MKRATMRRATPAELRTRGFEYLVKARQLAEKAEACFRAAARREHKNTEAEFVAAGAPPEDVDDAELLKELGGVVP